MGEVLRVRSRTRAPLIQCRASGDLAKASFYVEGVMCGFCRKCQRVVALNDNSQLEDHYVGEGYHSTQLVRSA